MIKTSRKATSYSMAPAPPTVTEAAELVWFGQAVSLGDFPDQYPIPNMVKIVQGEYMNLGPKDKISEGKENEILIYTVENTTKALGVNLRVTDGRGVIQTENKLAVPLSYEGWFEVLSEDGRRVKPIESIRDLARIFPHTCLVRKPIEALIPDTDGKVRNDYKRTVNVGETMTLFGVMQLTTAQNSEPVQFLRCLDYNGNSLYFQQDQQGLFSPVAGKENISGVHTIKGILNKFHLPVTCKLVHGSYPKNVDKNKFSGIMRLVYVYDEQLAFVCPANGQYRMIPIPTQVPMKVVPAVNFDDVSQTEVIGKVLERCKNMVKCYHNSIHLLYNVDVPPEQKNPGQQTNQTDEIKEVDPGNDQLYDEIEDIYFYVVRHGVTPPAVPKRLYREGEQDNDYWDQPIYKTLHKQRKRQSVVDLTKEADTKVYRFHEGENQSRPLAYVKTGNQVDQVISSADQPNNRLVVRRMSESAPAPQKKNDKKQRRKSQPAIFRILFGSKDDKDSAGVSKDSVSSDGSGGGKVQKPKGPRPNMYL